MKNAILLVTLFLSLHAQAAVESMFTPIGVVILTIRVPSGGNPDTDAATLWDRLLVTPQDSFMGPGKALKTDGKEMSVVCNQKKGGDICVITLNPKGKQSSRWLEIETGRQWAHFHMEGSEADFFTEKFKGPFESSDQKLRVFSEPGRFEIQFSGRGF